MYKLILLRHGESQWNLDNRFTGWTDVDLSQNGINEAKKAGILLKSEKIKFNIVYTSILKRANNTMKICLDELSQKDISIKYDWRLNERHYGKLQGLNKSEAAKIYGEKQILEWRRSYDTAPPPLDDSDNRHPKFDKLYEKIDFSQLPSSESLKDTERRFMPLWNNEISINIKFGATIMIVAHGNSLRALIKYLDNISDKEIIRLNIPTGIPLVYELDNNLKPLKHYYLGNQKLIDAKINSVINQSKI
jgi:2,3-bisphosphoglycerate-dependent phosphoglycerate mutase